MALPSVKKVKTLSKQAYDIIKSAIISNELKPGQAMIEEVLADQLSISRTPIRSALQQLHSEGILVLAEGKNLVVSNITLQDVYDVGAVRSTLESLAISKLANRVTVSDMNFLQEIVDKQKTCSGKGDSGNVEFLELDYNFHINLTKLARNNFLTEMVEKANFLTRRFLTLSGTLGKYSPTAIKEHEAVIQALREGKTEKAAALMAEHIEKAYNRMLIA